VGDAYDPAWGEPDARTYLVSRGITEEAAGNLALAWDDQQRRVLFPVRDEEGRLFGWTGRAVDDERQPKVRDYQGLPKRHMILGAERWRGAPGRNWPLVLVEGLFGYAHLVSLGVEGRCDVGALLGTVFTPEKLAMVRQRYQPTYLLMDDDDAGDACLFGKVERDATRTGGAIAALVDHVPLYVPQWPAGKGDPDELTTEELETMLRETKRWGS
jgi:DNA primase